MELAAGGSRAPARSMPPGLCTEEEGTVAAKPAGGCRAGVQYLVSLARWLGVGSIFLGLVEAVLAGVAVDALVPEVQDAPEGAYKPDRLKVGAPWR